MNKHYFKAIEDSDYDIYHIIDLTDTSIVGVTESYLSKDVYERSRSIAKNKEIKAHETIGAKVVGYGIFICLDENNMKSYSEYDKKYLVSVIRQMSVFFKEEVINNNPDKFTDYSLPRRSRSQAKSRTKEKTNEVNPNQRNGTESKSKPMLTGWKLVVFILLLVLFSLSLFFFPDFWETVMAYIFGGILAIIILLVYVTKRY